MRTFALPVLAFALYACGEVVDCPDGRAMEPMELALYSEVAAALKWSDDYPPEVSLEEPDPTCPGLYDIRVKGECVGAYYRGSCNMIFLPTVDHPEWAEGRRELLVKHESLHHILRQSEGGADGDHSRRWWPALGLL